jgi:hypothetical protein
MSSQRVVDLVAQLRDDPTLTKIELQQDVYTPLQLNQQDVALLVDATPAKHCISELKLNVDLYADAVEPLAEWLATLTQLTSLYLYSVSKQGLSEKRDAPTVQALLSQCTRLKKLKFYNGQLHPAVLWAVHDAFARYTGQLTSLNLSECTMDERHTAPLISLLMQQSDLKKLSLSGGSNSNQLQPKLFILLAKGTHHLTTLDLSTCNLDAAHTVSLSAWLSKQFALQSLYLSRNTELEPALCTAAPSLTSISPAAI